MCASKNPRLPHFDPKEDKVQVPQIYTTVWPMQSYCQKLETQVSHKSGNPSVRLLFRGFWSKRTWWRSFWRREFCNYCNNWKRWNSVLKRKTKRLWDPGRAGTCFGYIHFIILIIVQFIMWQTDKLMLELVRWKCMVSSNSLWNLGFKSYKINK